MGNCDTIARWICGQPGVFTSKEEAEKCAENTTYRFVYTSSYIIIALIFAILYLVIVTPKTDPKEGSINDTTFFTKIIMASIVGGAAWRGYTVAQTQPLKEQLIDEREIEKYINKGMDRNNSIEEVKQIRRLGCDAEYASNNRNRNINRNNRRGFSYNGFSLNM
jgi:hypothetical protein